MSKKTRKKIKAACKDLANFLCEKDKSYGSSVTNPVHIRSSGTPLELVLARQDDKLSRMIRGKAYKNDNDAKDFVGYWVLEQVIRTPETAKPAKLPRQKIKKIHPGDVVECWNSLPPEELCTAIYVGAMKNGKHIVRFPTTDKHTIFNHVGLVFEQELDGEE